MRVAPRCHRVPVANQADLQAALQTTAAVGLVIAPETQGSLLQACRTVRAHIGLLLNAPDALIELTSSKHQTATWLATHKVPCPAGALLCDGEQSPPEELTFPLVIKPDDGCGSQGVRLVRSPDAWPVPLAGGGAWRVEEFVPGHAGSAAALCGHGVVHWLRPCWQQLVPNSFGYTGSQIMTDALSIRRAEQLVRRLDPLLTDAVGYMGVDFVLGESADGSADYVIEINPRLTSSYVCLSQFCEDNLVATMLKLAFDHTASRCDT